MRNCRWSARNDCSDGGERKPVARASAKKGCMNGKGGPENVSCPYKGVRQRTWGKWVSEIRDPNSGNRLWLGSYDSSRDAALAYDVAARMLFGLNAELNLPDEDAAPPPRPKRAVALDAAVAKARYQHHLMDMKMKEEFERQMLLEMFMNMMLQQQHQKLMQMENEGALFYPPTEYDNITNSIDTYYYPINHGSRFPDYKETVDENDMVLEETVMNILNPKLPEFDDSQMWVEAASTLDFHQAFCDPGIAAHTFDDAIGIDLKHPLAG